MRKILDSRKNEGNTPEPFFEGRHWSDGGVRGTFDNNNLLLTILRSKGSNQCSCDWSCNKSGPWSGISSGKHVIVLDVTKCPTHIVRSQLCDMGRPTDSVVTSNTSLTVRDNRTGKVYNVP